MGNSGSASIEEIEAAKIYHAKEIQSLNDKLYKSTQNEQKLIFEYNNLANYCEQAKSVIQQKNEQEVEYIKSYHILKYNFETSQKELFEAKLKIESFYTENKQLVNIVNELQTENKLKDIKIQSLIDKKIEEDPRTNHKYLEIQNLYERFTNDDLYDFLDSFLMEKDLEDEIYEFLIQFLIFDVQLNNKNDVEKISEDLKNQLELKFNIESVSIEEVEKVVFKVLDFHLRCKETKQPITFVNNLKMKFDTEKTELHHSHLRITKIIVPGIRIGGTLISKAKVQVSLQ